MPTTEVSAHSAGSEDVPRIWPFNATEKLDPDISELLSMHCSWCVLYCGEAQRISVGAEDVDDLLDDLGQAFEVGSRVNVSAKAVAAD